jgi:glycerophosphoryl diester phosphodiesterase
MLSMNRSCSAIAILALLVIGPAVAAERPATIEDFMTAGGGTWVIAHRGFSGRAPENTLVAVREAIAIGAHMAEIDVTLSADEHIVVIHDETLDRTTNGRGLVSEFTLAELKKLDAGSWFSPQFAGEPIPTLDEILSETQGRILLNVEIKSEAVDRGVTAKVVDAIRARGMVDEVVVSSFSPTALEQMREVAPEILTAVLYNIKLQRGMDPIDIVSGVGASGFNIRRNRLSKKMLRRCHAHEIPVAIYTVDKPRRMRKFIARGVDAIFTNHPDRMLEIVGEGSNLPLPPILDPVPSPP